MRLKNAHCRREGSILPLVVVSLVGICGFVALAIDIGMIAVAKTQAQNAVDAAAMAGARSLDGSTTQNLGAVGTTGTAMDNASVIAYANLILGGAANSVTITPGSYHYSDSSQLFSPVFPAAGGSPTPPDNYNLMQVTVTYNVTTAFAPVFSIINPSFNSVVTVTATSIAAHRPRDTAIVLDFSGSMNNESDLWNDESYLDNGSTNSTNGYTWPKSGNPNWTSNNTETVFPMFGHYTNSSGYTDYPHYANLLSPTADSSNTSGLYGNTLIGKCNNSIPISGVSATVGDFYQSALGSPVQSAFSSAPDNFQYGNDITDSYTDANGVSWTSTAANPQAQGDNYLPKSGKTITSGASATPAGNLAATVNQVIGGTTGTTTYNTSWETQGYKAFNGNATFQGYTVGPRYWGKTFFIWPPDPTNDWRKKFFFLSDGVTPLNDNTKLFTAGNVTGGGNGFNDPAGNYVINYKAILNWIKNTGPNAFPPILRGGYVSYYSSIPTDVPSAAYNHSNTNTSITWPDDATRFWKEYIDHALGVWRDPNGNIQHPQASTCSYGPDYMFPAGITSVKITAPPTGSPAPYMNYDDNPYRPRHRMWFGPMTMIQYMADTGILPGTAHDISTFVMKQGVAGAMTDIQNNHPNDNIAMLLFSRPQFNNDSAGTGSFNRPQFNLNNDYTAMLRSIWLSPQGTSADVTPWSTYGVQVPHVHGDYDSNTTSDYAFMLAYNQFSSAATLQAAQSDNLGPVGGLGRKGATKLIIYETDGMANQGTSVPGGFVTTGGAYNSYYAIRPGDTINSSGYSQSALTTVVQNICNLDSNTTAPGFSTSNRPVIVQCIAFGAIFENSNSIQTSAVSLLQAISTIGGTVFPSSASDPTNGYKWCIGTLAQRQSKLQTAFLNILDSSVPVSLIQ